MIQNAWDKKIHPREQVAKLAKKSLLAKILMRRYIIIAA
jgi:hypothetical protein